MDVIRAISSIVHQVWAGAYFIVLQPPITFADILLHGMSIPFRLVLSIADIPIELNWDFIKLMYLFINVSIIAGVCMGIVAGVLMCITRFTLNFNYIPLWIPSLGLVTEEKDYFDTTVFSTVEQPVKVKKEESEEAVATGGGASDVIYEDDDGYYKKYSDDLFSRVSGETELTSDLEPDKLGEIPEEEEDV